MRNILITLWGVCFIASCATNMSIQEKSMKVELGEVSSSSITINDVFSVKGCVLLDTCKECQLKNIDKIEVFSDAIYVLDRTGQKSVCKFDLEGHFLCKIGKIGKGHGEYRFANDFTIDPHTGNVMILGENSNIYIYDQNSSFVTSKCVSKSLMWNIQATDDGIYMSTNHQTFTSGDNAFLLYKYDSTLKEIGKWIPVLPKYMGLLPLQSVIFQNRGKEIYYTDDKQNCLFSYDLKSASFTKSLSIIFPNPCPSELKESTNSFMINQMKYDYLKDLYIGEKTIYSTYFCNGKLFISVIDKENGSVHKEGIFVGYYPRLFPIGHDEFLAVVNPEIFDSFEEWNNLLTSYNMAYKHFDNYLLVKLKMTLEK